jgi:hypothetical protein
VSFSVTGRERVIDGGTRAGWRDWIYGSVGHAAKPSG